MSDVDGNRWRQYDLYQRYRVLAQMLEAAFPDGPVAVLDVGAGADDLCRTFLPQRFVITPADTETHGRPDIVPLENDRPLPFADGAFDVVLAMDVLEHVPPEARAGFVRELARVSRQAVVLSHPRPSPQVVAAEAVVAAAHERWFRSECTFLNEHATNGLPSPDLARGELIARGFTVIEQDNAPLTDWLPCTVMDVALLARFGLGGPKDRFNEAVNAATVELISPGEHYRVFVVGTREAGVASPVAAALVAGRRPRTAADDLRVGEILTHALLMLAEDPRLVELTAAVTARDERLRQLETDLRASDAALAEVVRAKDEHIRKLGLLMQEKDAVFTEVVRAKDEHIGKLEHLLRRAALQQPQDQRPER